MASKVEIANAALLQLGGAPITDFTDNTTSGSLVRRFWDITVDEVLSDAAWTGTTRRASLAVIDTTPAYEFTYAYQLPTNPYCLQVLSVSDSYSTDFPWRREGDQILTDVTSLAITYSARITDTSQYGPHLTKTLTYCLASKLAKPITGSTQEAKYFLELYNDTLEKCRAMDGTQGTSEIWTSTSLTDDVR